MSRAQQHILVIDDNEDILHSVSTLLIRKAFKVSIKTRIENIVQEVTGIAPDLILLDKNLGWEDGCNLCRLLKSNEGLRHIPVIMFSAYYKKRTECLQAGADSFLEKPFEMNALLNLIGSLQ